MIMRPNTAPPPPKKTKKKKPERGLSQHLVHKTINEVYSRTYTVV